MTRRIGLGIVGCGTATQLLHLPSLRELPEFFEVTALVDVSRQVLDAVSVPYPDARLYDDPMALVGDKRVEAVLVANPHAFHAQMGVAFMRAQKHVLIEKPVCVTRADLDALLKAECDTGVVAQVGYNRRHAPALIEAKGLIAQSREPIRFARVSDLVGPNSHIVDSTVRVIARGDDVPQSVFDANQKALTAQISGEIAVDSGPLARCFSLLLGLSTHDTSAMRYLLGDPREVLYARNRHQGAWVSAAFDYGDFICHFETGIYSLPQLEAHVEVVLNDATIRVDYDTPFVRHLPAKLTVTEAIGTAGINKRSGFATRNDTVVAEWRAFHDSIVTGTRPECSIEDAGKDLELFRKMIDKMR